MVLTLGALSGAFFLSHHSRPIPPHGRAIRASWELRMVGMQAGAVVKVQGDGD